MNGTDWTEPGQGATMNQLSALCFEQRKALGLSETPMPVDFFNGDWAKPTNLRLTGAPLTADDLKRIAEAK